MARKSIRGLPEMQIALQDDAPRLGYIVH